MLYSLDKLHFLFILKKSQKNKNAFYVYTLLNINSYLITCQTLLWSRYKFKIKKIEKTHQLCFAISGPSLFKINLIFQAVLGFYQKIFTKLLEVNYTFLNTSKKTYTVVRSPFVYKSSREQLEVSDYKIKLEFQTKNIYVSYYLENFLTKLLFWKTFSVKKNLKKKISSKV